MSDTAGYLADGSYLSLGIPGRQHRIAIFEDTEFGTAEEVCEHARRALNAYGPLVAFARFFVNDSQSGKQAEQLLKDIGEDTP